MIRRRSQRSQGPGLLRTVGRTAAIAGTATAVSHGVANRMTEQPQQHQAPAQPASPPAQPTSQADIQSQFETARAAEFTDNSGGDLIVKLQQLADLRNAGMLTDAEFEQAKARVLGQ